MDLSKSTQEPFPKVSLLTVNYQQAQVTLELYHSLKSLSYPSWELVIVNNGSEDKELEEGIAGDERIQLVNSGENLGFAGGNNFGLRYCTGDYVFFINNDTEASPGMLEPLVELFQKTESLGMVSPKIIFYSDKSRIQYAGATELNEYTMRNRGIGYGENDQGQYDRVYPTAYIHGAAMMVPVKVIKEVGPMREDYFLYYEEYDWCYRIKQAGYGIYYCGKSHIYHKESMSTGADSPLKTYYLTRNRLLFARRNFSSIRAVINTIFFSLISMPVHLVRYRVSGRKDLARACWTGWLWNLNRQNK